MKAVTIRQPWASLVAIGAKRIESRSWSTSYRGPLAIHAAKVFPESARNFAIGNDRAWGALREGREYLNVDKLPRGAVVATCNLIDVVRIRTMGPSRVLEWHYWNHRETVESGETSSLDWDDATTWRIGDEKAFGDYSPGRFAWLLADVVKLDPPVPAVGHQRLWEWEG